MRGGNLESFDAANKVFTHSHNMIFFHSIADKVFVYSPHVFKHLDAWVPVGDPMWDLYSKIRFDDPKRKLDDYLPFIRGFCPYVNEMIDQLVSGDTSMIDPTNASEHKIMGGIPMFRFVLNDIVAWISFHPPNKLMIHRIVPVGITTTAGYEEAYNEANATNICSVKWKWLDYIKPNWTTIRPYSAAAKMAYHTECTKGKSCRGYAACQKIYDEAVLIQKSRAASEEEEDDYNYEEEFQRLHQQEKQKELEKEVVESDFVSLTKLVNDKQGALKNKEAIQLLLTKITRHYEELGTTLNKVFREYGAIHNYNGSEATKITKKINSVRKEFCILNGIQPLKSRSKKKAAAAAAAAAEDGDEEGNEDMSSEEIAQLFAASNELNHEEPEAEKAPEPAAEKASETKGEKHKTKRRKTKRRKTKRRTPRHRPRPSTLRARRRTRVV